MKLHSDVEQALSYMMFVIIVVSFFTFCSVTKAQDIAVSCDYNGRNLIFTHSLPKNNIIDKDIEYSDNYSVHISAGPLTGAEFNAVILEEKDGVLIKNNAECFYTN